MSYSSVQVTAAMRRRLARYKSPGQSYEDVLGVLLDAIPPEELRARVAASQRAAREVLARVGRRTPDEAATEARHIEASRILRMAPGARMDEAYRLFETIRGSP